MQLDARKLFRIQGRDQRSPLHFDVDIEKVEVENVFVRAFVILVASWSLLSSCADTKQADSNSVIREPDSDYEVHGEVGAMYGHTTR